MSQTDRRAQPEAAVPEPVAVIGMGCRFPGGGDTPEEFWGLLTSGRSTAGELPAERWKAYAERGPDSAAMLRRAIRRGSFLTEIDGFDAEFFGISPREAENMDPSQRLLLEVAWESLENAGVPPRSLAGSEAGVFVGLCTDDYGRRQLEDLPNIEAWTGIGAAFCAAANRISHVLDLRGPSIAIDTACSASLVALHLACQSLRLGESSIALAGGVNLIAAPGYTLTLAMAGALAPDGRSKPFDAAADGYGRGEGCGVVVLKLLSDAQRDGDRVLAVVRGSAVSQDGRTNGIMAPCGEAQEHVMLQACRQASIPPASVGYVEAHGTGTPVGDPLEAAALSAVYGAGRTDGPPCLIGSVKSNIGHLEGAAGVSGVIKAVLCLVNDQIPATLLVSGLNPQIPWGGSGIRVVTRSTGWPRGDRPRRAAVSGFGYGGTVAHVILEEAPAAASEPAPPGGGPAQVRAYPLSAGSPAALREQAADLASWLSERAGAAPMASVGHTLALRRSHLQHRAVVLAADGTELAARLRGLAGDRPTEGLITGSPIRDRGAGLVWVFGGHGSQWDGMGRDLLASEPSFARVIETLDPIFVEEIGFSPRRLLLDGGIESVDQIQTMIFAMQTGLAAVWHSYGVRPDAVIGHSVGEVAAAVAAGALSLEDGGRLICTRSRLLRRVAGQGAMAMVGLPFAQVDDLAGAHEGVAAAISASPASTVVSGDPAAVAALAEQWQSQGIFVRTVASDVAFHSPQMDPLLDEILVAVESLSPELPRLPMYSTSRHEQRFAPLPDGSYWAGNLRNPCHLTEAVTAAAQDGYRAFLEISPHPVVSHSLGETLEAAGIEDAFVGVSLRRRLPERVSMLAAAAAVHCAGIGVEWPELQPEGALVTLPPTRWQRRRLWKEGTPEAGSGSGEHDIDSHSLLGAELTIAGSQLRAWRSSLDDANRPYPGSHALNGVEIVPAGVLLTTFLRAAADGGAPPVLTGIFMRQALMTAKRREIQVVLDGATARLASRSMNAKPGPWLTNVTASVAPDDPAAALDAGALRGDLATADKAHPGLIRERLAQVGVPDTGFDWSVEELRCQGRALRAVVHVGQQEPAPATWSPVFDAITSIAPAAYAGAPVLRMLVSVDELAVSAQEPPERVIIQITPDDVHDDAVHALAADPEGRVVARLDGLRYAVLGAETAASTPRMLVHTMDWRPVGPAAGERADADYGAAADDGAAYSGPVVVVGPDAVRRQRFQDALAAAGADCRGVAEVGEVRASDADVVVLPPVPGSSISVAAAAIQAAEHVRRCAEHVAGLDTRRPARLWFLTAGVRESADPAGLAASSLWGMARVMFAQHPVLRGGVIDLDPGGDVEPQAALLSALRAGPREDVTVLRDGTVHVARLARLSGPGGTSMVQCRADASYLVTGGLSRIGLAAAGWLADRGARRVVLADPRPVPPRSAWDEPGDEETRLQIEAIRALEARGVMVALVALDMTADPRVTSMLTPDSLGLPAIRGVVHAAGLAMRRSGAASDETPRGAALATVRDAWMLHELFPRGSVDFLVLMSAATHLSGAATGTIEVAASAFLDALARHRGAGGNQDTIGLSVLAAVPGAVAGCIPGAVGVSASQALEALDFAAQHGPGNYVVLSAAGPDGGEGHPLLAELASPGADDMDAGTDPALGDDVPGWSGLSPEELREQLLEEVTANIAVEMRLAAADLDTERPLVEQGLDSVMTVVVRRRLEKRFRRPLPTTLLWGQPTVSAIAEHLHGLLSQAEPEPEPVAEVVGAGQA